MKAHLKGIGVENYRIFEKAQYFDFAPITLLTGANSSGKSSLIKALKFLNETYRNAYNNELQYQAGDLEKLFTQNKTFDFKTNPLLNTTNVLNHNSKNKVYSLYHYQYLPGVGEDIRLLIKFNYDVEDIINFKSITISIDSIKETQSTIALEKALLESRQISFDGIKDKEIISIGIFDLGIINLKIDLDLLFFIYKNITENSLQVYEQELKIYNQKIFLEDELNILDNEKIRQQIEIYFKALNIEYEIINYKNEEGIVKLGIRGTHKQFGSEKYYLDSQSPETNVLIRNNNKFIFKNLSYDLSSIIERWLGKDFEKISSFKNILRLHFSSELDEENEKKFIEGTYKFLSSIYWTNYFFLKEESPDQYWKSEIDGLNTSFIDFLKTVGKGANMRLDIHNKAICGFSLYTVNNFLKIESKKEYFDPTECFNILKRHFNVDIDRDFFDSLIIPFLNLLSEGDKTEPLVYMEVAEAYTKDDIQNFSNWCDNFHHGFLRNIFTDILKPLTSFRNIVLISNDRTSADLFFNINSERELNSIKNFNDNKNQRALIIEILKDLDIADDISVELDNEQKTYKILLSVRGCIINLKELGYGIVKLLPIILSIRPILEHSEYIDLGNDNRIAHNKYYPTTVIIEEPESNLHPALQSKLAVMFVKLSKQFNIQFIIETHSEYLIRKLQYLTAKGEISPNATKIHYFYHPDKIPAGETQTFPINIREDGSLTRNFGTGFFDAADNIALELFLLKTHQSN